MGWLTRQLAKVAPGFALRREVASRRLERLDQMAPRRGKGNGDAMRSFEAVSGNRLYHDFLAPRNSADSALSGAESLRHHVRQLEYNSGFVSGPVKRIANNVVGPGIRFQSRVRPDDPENRFTPFPTITEARAQQWNYEMERLHRKWARQADKRLILTWGRIQWLAEAALVRDGAVLVVGRESRRRDRVIPYCLELLEIDRLQTPMSEFNNPRVRAGVRYDDEGAPEAYFVLKRHPGESLGRGMKADDFEEVPAFYPSGAKKVIHLFNPVRPEQSQGFSPFAAGLKGYMNLDRYHEAEIYAALEDACMTGIVKTPNPDGFQAGYTVDNLGSEDGGGTEPRIHEFAPGMVHYLNPGEEFDMHKPNRPGDAFGELTAQLLRDPANALDIPPEVLSQAWQGMNYSNARTVLLQFYLTCRLRQAYLIEELCRPVHENEARYGVAYGKISGEGFDRRSEDFLSFAGIPPGWHWVDPEKEAKAADLGLSNNTETLADLCASRGEDVDEHLETRARELQRMQELEEKYGITFPRGSKGQDGAGNSGGEEEDEEKDDPRPALSLAK